jgi:arabinan endo-1,5-alpha-L-arabinosidase
MFKPSTPLVPYLLTAILLAHAIPPAPAAATSDVRPPLRGHLRVHDPSTIVQCKDRYYMFGSGQGIVTKWSADKTFWNGGSPVFSNAPAWTTNAVPGFTGNFWAPDVFYLNGRYCVYYSISTWGSQVSAIGLVTNPTLDPADPTYRWTDRGIVIRSEVGSPYNTIDPSVCLDAAGNPWMAFGSYWTGIYVVQLDPLTGLRIAPDSPTHRVAYNSSIEASCLFRRCCYYYLFVNWGSCCVGVKSTYNVRVGRSTSPSGPFRDRNGVDLAANGGTLFLEGTGKFTGPGHVAVLDEGGRQWFSYHYYDANAYAPWYGAFGVANFDLEPLSWTADAWPVFTNDWSAAYRFESDARDLGGQYDGLVRGGAGFVDDPVRGRVLAFNGTNQFVQLPPGVAFARTFVAVVKWDGGGAWQRIFDFGTDTSSYVMLTPSSGNGRLRCDIRANGITQTLETSRSLTPGIWAQVALTFDGQRGVLFLDGAPIATNLAVTLSPLEVLAQTNHLGRSKFGADPDFRGRISSFRAYGRVLSAPEIAAPRPVISAPSDGAAYSPGSRIDLRGAATDLRDAPLPASALTWRIDCEQDGRTNVALGPLTGAREAFFSIPTDATGGGTYRCYLTATDGAGRTATVSAALHPAHPATEAESYYPLRSDARDVPGHFDGTLQGGASFAVDPERGPVLSLNGSGQYLSLPTAAGGAMTIMAWVKWGGGSAGQRIFDFGNGAAVYAALTPSAANGKLRFAITVNGSGGEQTVDAAGPLPIGTWTHVALALDGRTATLYTNGLAAGTNAFLNLVPDSLDPTNVWLGRGPSAASWFNGQLSDVRLFSRPLNATEIAAPRPWIAKPAQGALYRPGETLAFAGSAQDFVGTPLEPAQLTWTVSWMNGNSATTVLGPIGGVTNGSLAIPAEGAAATNGYYRFRLVATDTTLRRTTNSVDVFPAASANATGGWASFYPFTTGPLDASNRFNGSLLGGAAIVTDPVRGPALQLAGTSQHASLPAGAAGLRTFSAWVKWNGGGNWQRIFDFGRDTTRWFFLCPKTDTGVIQCALAADSDGYVHTIEATNALPVGVWTHVAIALDGRQGALYLNGQPVAVNNSVNLLPSDVGATRCYLGRSQFPADPYFSGRLDSVRLNERALSLAEIVGPAPVIATPAAGALFAGGDSIQFEGYAYDYADARLPTAALTWTADFFRENQPETVLRPVAGAASGTLLIATHAPLSTNLFYRLHLRATDALGNQGATWVDLSPRIATLALESAPAGLRLTVDGQPFVTPAVLPLCVGMSRTIAAPSPQSLGNKTYDFVVWSDAGAPQHALSMADSTRLTAAFVWPEIAAAGNGTTVTLRWPDWSAAGFDLESATDLRQPSPWHALVAAPEMSNGYATLSFLAATTAAYYRLHRR